ncbi:glycosyltransferase involved in cell wall biosynthesis [Parabacteroides sp. PH5-13]|uniref:glycosyltransferase n=1 Tax=unclassified Parabacteroides TaxID=2649774 RepID=UPI0024752A75|nr:MULTISPECIES: glycosyltransferase [unclassified Parabacteroides]MDH6305589.1 glycosyltransferase involved in cell wall biosynthesis [Parabacteroides sp. PH5-39]MDH6319856.1 glycosyltransferase involved in cell wall biosynthesis [Parabacteroides sp. PH5-13]MDH6323553.1 glycosyltransferase involved in cell wall biosynthesis [Parabacteroides sp. PH5-8]MDH6384665.1 glycosyltransferase involved in cell wall biosynthesis [Parabacteroides sp. PH5-17]MDH6394020.1 glycosyltransferase involved in cel
MKILFFIDELGSGGAQRQMYNLALEFKTMGHQIEFLTYRDSDFYAPLLEEKGIKELRINSKNYFDRILKCRFIIRKGNYDAVLAFLEGPCFIAELSVLPFKNWTLVVGERSANPKILTSLKQKLYRILHPLADYIVANSYSNMDMLLKVNPFLKKNKTKVIYNLYNIADFKINPDFNFLKNEVLHITIPSNFRYWKNLDGLIEGVRLLSTEDKKKLKIHWYGYEFEIDDSMKQGKNKIEQYGLSSVFTLHPPTLKILDIMSASDAIGLFSHFEGLSNAICEGMALGKPIITTRVSDNELLIKDRETGFLCDSTLPEDIAKAIHELLSQSKEKLYEMGKKNRLYFQKTFDKDTVCSQYLQLLTSNRKVI